MHVVNRHALTLTLAALCIAALPATSSARPHNSITFSLVLADAALLPCLTADDGGTPSVKVTVRRGLLGDHLRLVMDHVKPGLRFTLFTLQHSSLLSDGTADPAFAGLGLGWYQSDAHATRHPSVTEIDTVLIDHIFGIDADPAVNLAPTQTLHLGLFFDDPTKAATCGFAGTTPFNATHSAGPLAFVSKPDTATGLGPLCTKPDTSTVPATCKP